MGCQVRWGEWGKGAWAARSGGRSGGRVFGLPGQVGGREEWGKGAEKENNIKIHVRS